MRKEWYHTRYSAQKHLFISSQANLKRMAYINFVFWFGFELGLDGLECDTQTRYINRSFTILKRKPILVFINVNPYPIFSGRVGLVLGKTTLGLLVFWMPHIQWRMTTFDSSGEAVENIRQTNFRDNDIYSLLKALSIATSIWAYLSVFDQIFDSISS